MRRLLLCLMILLFTPKSLYATTAQPLELTPRISLVGFSLPKNEKNEVWLHQQKSIRIGVWGEIHPPFSIVASNGIYQGVTADVIGLMQKSIGLPFEIYWYPDAATALSALDKGEIMMLPVWKTKDASTDPARLTRPWLHDHWTLLARHTDERLIKSTGIVEGSDVSPLSKASRPGGVSVRYMKSYSAALNDLSFGQLDAVWITKMSADYLISTASRVPLPLVTVATQPASLHFSVNRQHPELLELINGILSAMPLTHKTQLAQGWGIPLAALLDNKAPTEVLKQNITVIVDTRQSPLSFQNRQQQTTGLLIDLLALIKSKFTLDFQIMTASDDAELATLMQRYPEALPPVKWHRSEDATGNASSSGIHWLATQSIVLINKSTQPPQSFAQLSGEKIAILGNDPLLAWLETRHPTIRLDIADSVQQALIRLKNNHIRGVIMPLIQANYLLNEPGNSDVKIGIALPTPDLVLTTPLSESSFTSGSILKAALTALTPAEINQIMAKWRFPAASTPDDAVISKRSSIYLILMSISLLIIVIGTVAYSIRRKKSRLSVPITFQSELNQPDALQHDFFRYMHHEMGNHLHGLRGLLDLELQKTPLTSESHENLSTMQQATAQLVSLTATQHDFITIADSELPGISRPVILTQLLENIIARAKALAQAQNITLVSQHRLSAVEYQFNVFAVTRILLSIVLNAIKHSHAHQITIFVAESRPSGLLFEVADNGTFTNTASDQPDSSLWGETGLNLEQCKRLAKGIMGDISIETPTGQGTIISLFVPAEPIALSQPALTPSLTSITILVIDDHSPSRRLLEALLQQQGCDVMTAEDGLEGLRIWQENRSVIKGIITDLAMPNMDGFSLARTLRQAAIDSPLIITALSASDDFATVEMSLQAGMNDCLSKPLNAATLAAWLQRHFGTIADSAPVFSSLLKPEHHQEWQEINTADIAALRHACSQLDRNAIARIAHRLISTAHLLNNDELRTYCIALEKNANHLTKSVIESMIDKIDAQIAKPTSKNKQEE